SAEAKKPPVFDVPLKPVTRVRPSKWRAEIFRKCLFPVLTSTSLSTEGTATFIAKVGGEPIPSVKWMKGKWRQLTHGGRISIVQKGQETFSAEICENERLTSDLCPFRTPSKQKSPQEEKDIDIVELLRNVDPKEYEKYARMYGITDYRGLLQAIEQLKKERGEESGRPVRLPQSAARLSLQTHKLLPSISVFFLEQIPYYT
uniref:MyBP-C tri-helix bundle domain-containing protein n=1 Tax=Xiphophorus couchianus TaxID=32473 RepID=A0A3B5MIR7_9TELE